MLVLAVLFALAVIVFGVWLISRAEHKAYLRSCRHAFTEERFDGSDIH